jgi:hypothetical protein
MLKAERETLLQLTREREKLAKNETDVRAAQREAQFEAQLAAEYGWDSEETWSSLYKKAKAAEQELNRQIAQDFQAKGIPLQFAPSCYLSWAGRGMNACKDYRAELRRVFKAKNEHDTAKAKLMIQQASLDIRTKLMAGALESPDAKAFLETMPTPEQLMPAVTVEEVRKLLAFPGERRERISDFEEEVPFQ